MDHILSFASIILRHTRSFFLCLWTSYNSWTLLLFDFCCQAPRSHIIDIPSLSSYPALAPSCQHVAHWRFEHMPLPFTFSLLCEEFLLSLFSFHALFCFTRWQKCIFILCSPFFLNGKCIPIVYSSSCSSFLITFFWPFGGFIDRTAQDMIGNRMRERGRDTRQRASRQGLEPGAAAARTKPLHMERLLHQPSWTAPQEQISWVSITEGNHICWLAAIEFRQLSKPCLCLKFDYTKISHKMTCNAW